MGTVIALLVVIAALLWWIRSALEPVRAYFAGKVADAEEREEKYLRELRDDTHGDLAQILPDAEDRAALRERLSRRAAAEKPDAH